MKRIVYLVQDWHFIFAGPDGIHSALPSRLGQADILRVGALQAFRDDATATDANFKASVQERRRIQLPVVPGAFNELYHQDSLSVARGAKSVSHRCRRLALPGPRENHQKTAKFIHFFILVMSASQIRDEMRRPVSGGIVLFWYAPGE